MKFTGTPGHSFTLTAEHAEQFGKHPGKVTLHGRRLNIESWSPTVIIGDLPVNALPGPVVVTTGDTHAEIHDATEINGGYGYVDRFGAWFLTADEQVAADMARRGPESPEQRTARHAHEDAAHPDETPDDQAAIDDQDEDAAETREALAADQETPAERKARVRRTRQS